MNDEKFENLGPILASIGEEAADIVGGDPDGLYIYGEVASGTQYASVFKESASEVRYFDPSQRLFKLLEEAWESESADEKLRWTAIEYGVRGIRFDVQFAYPEQLDPDEYCSDRCDAAVSRRFGDKPVIYPPIPEEFREFKRES